MLELKSELKNYSINLPTDLKELTPEILAGISADIDLPKFYAIVALCFQVKLYDIAINVTGSKEQTVQVIPILVKIDEEDAARMNTKVGHKLIVDRSSLERGVHLHIPIMINSNNVKNYIREDEKLRTRLIKGGDGSKDIVNIAPVTKSKRDIEEIKTSKSPLVYILEFKIIPITDISASLPVDAKIIDPFKTKSNLIVN